MSTLLSCQACGWSRTFGWPEPARHAALHHMCETPPTATGVVAETATRPDARPVPSEQTQPKPEPPAGGGQPPAGVDRPASTTGAASRQRSAHRMVPAPVYADDRLALYAGDAIDVLSGLPDNHVDCVVTSPPYWGLRDYGTGRWVGGNRDCDHDTGPGRNVPQTKRPGVAYPPALDRGGHHPRRCRRCGASRRDRQYGLEATAEDYVQTLRAVFSQLRRVLAPSGTAWLNLGDCYSAHPPGATGDPMRASTLTGRHAAAPLRESVRRTGVDRAGGLPRKNLIGMPWRVAFALQADGWILRNAVVWHKPNAMPESVRDRLSNRYEMLFLLTRQPRYYFDLDPVRQPLARPEARGQNIVIGGTGKGTHAWRGSTSRRRGHTTYGKYADTEAFTTTPGQALRPTGRQHTAAHPEGRNPGDVWTLATRPLPEAHFAAFPVDIPLRCIAAGCPPGGLVLDPFSGAATTGLAALQLRRRYLGIDLNPAFHDIARRRLDLPPRADEAAHDQQDAA